MLYFFNSINSIFVKKDKIRLFKVILLKSILGLLELISVVSFIPFFYFISDKNFLSTNSYILGLNNYLKFNEVQLILLVIITPLSMLFFLNFYRLLTNWIEAKTINDLWKSFHSNLYNYYLDKSYLYHVENSSNILLNNFITRANDALTGFMIPMYLLIGSFLTSAIIILGIIIYNPIVSLISFIFIIIFYLTLFRFLRTKVDKFSKFSPIFSKKTFQIVEESFKSIKSIKISGNKSFFHSQFDKNANIYANNSATVQFLSTVPKAAIEIFAYTLAFSLTFFYMHISDQNISKIIVVVSVYLITLQKLIPLINDLFSKYYAILKNRDTFELIKNDLKNSEVLSTQEKHNISNIQSLNFNKNIHIKNIKFSYNEKSKFLLNINELKINKGDILGITGQSGSGKSTFLNIITGLIFSKKGKILIDNIEINNELSIKKYQKLIGYLPQNIFILNDSIRKNIAFGLDDKKIDFNKLKKAAQLACIDKYIESDLPQKYETEVGENAIKLSGGQRQRIGIARSLYLDKDILIFDEATNSLDEETEIKVISNILSLKNKTIILVTHNLALLKKIKRVFNFENGNLKQQND